MWGRKSKADAAAVAIEPPSPLTQAMRQARVEVAERSSVVVDLRDAELARLELLNEALNPLFAEIPGDVDLFDRGISRGDTPRLWIDSVAHVAMGRDKRIYRFLLDTRVGRRVLTESHDIAEIVQAVTTYVARRLVERQRALDEDPDFINRVAPKAAAREYRRRRWRSFGWLVLGFLLGSAALIVAALIFAARS
jgi:hypothetical protein